MAAEIAMLAVALKDNPLAVAFVFLPHDAVPLVPLFRQTSFHGGLHPHVSNFPIPPAPLQTNFKKSEKV
eukprot:1016268-Amphidinium_carterae.2